jgi:hypothetical protein
MSQRSGCAWSAHTAALARVLETVLLERQCAWSERQALAAAVGRLAGLPQQIEQWIARLSESQPGPVLPPGALGRSHRTQRERANLRTDLGWRRQRYGDAPDGEAPSAEADRMPS